MDEPHRPGPLRWLLYVFGAGLPDRHRTWVLHDVTVPTWQLRHLVRVTVQLLPIGVALYLLIPGPVYVRALSVLAGALLGYFYSVAYMYESAEHRVVKAGYPVGHAAAVRAEAGADERDAARERYERRWRS
ncbi:MULTISPECIES: DUF5313 family protein [unclassified Pseudonocardia]|uniref:DUF5313 family protein n=1 Tax=unclassified Pseudonocardia TaxID=2619320 RepID=UPI0001FFE82E|nr:DUF5313 family protein [Pseudonocardia sp. Ae707_Ps1]OLM17523.1 hypothetical protein Ae707Ps1_1782 [Pseudonocardia sp. Ae707_Ps1]